MDAEIRPADQNTQAARCSCNSQLLSVDHNEVLKNVTDKQQRLVQDLFKLYNLITDKDGRVAEPCVNVLPECPLHSRPLCNKATTCAYDVVKEHADRLERLLTERCKINYPIIIQCDEPPVVQFPSNHGLMFETTNGGLHIRLEDNKCLKKDKGAQSQQLQNPFSIVLQSKEYDRSDSAKKVLLLQDKETNISQPLVNDGSTQYEKQNMHNASQHGFLDLRNEAEITQSLKSYKGRPSLTDGGCEQNFYIWTIKADRLAIVEKEPLWSESFYLGYPGYRLKMKLEQTRMHLGIYICLVPGGFDDSLAWPFEEDVQFVLLDQTASGKNYARGMRPYPSDEDERGIWDRPVKEDSRNTWGIPDFIPSSMLRERLTPYIRNSQMHIAVRLF